MARVKLIENDAIPDHLSPHVQVNREAEAALFNGKPANINSAKLTAHIPLINRWIIPLIASMQRNGAGSVLPPKVKAMADIKTSLVNDCAY